MSQSVFVLSLLTSSVRVLCTEGQAIGQMVKEMNAASLRDGSRSWDTC